MPRVSAAQELGRTPMHSLRPTWPLSHLALSHLAPSHLAQEVGRTPMHSLRPTKSSGQSSPVDGDDSRYVCVTDAVDGPGFGVSGGSGLKGGSREFGFKGG